MIIKKKTTSTTFLERLPQNDAPTVVAAVCLSFCHTPAQTHTMSSFLSRPFNLLLILLVGVALYLNTTSILYSIHFSAAAGSAGCEPQAAYDSVPPAHKNPRLPSKPIPQSRLNLLSTAKPIELTYVDMAYDLNKEFPHKGAKDEQGNWGYVHDETALRKNPPEFAFPNLDRACAIKDDQRMVLTEKVFVDLESHEAAEKSGQKRDKIFCLVYTMSTGHDQIPYIRETWGPKCDGFMVGSNKTDASIDAVDIPHEGAEEFDNIWQKVRSMWAYIYDNYYDKYDWFHIGGGDLFLIVENLRLYLESEEIKVAANGGVYLPDGSETVQTPLFLGRRFAFVGDMDDIFISGGSGYTLNKAALKALVVHGLPNYFLHDHTFSEDRMIAQVFKKMGIIPYDTKDEAGGERYMPFMVRGLLSLLYE
jgi:glycoprotein-N-acetylgalactosamine 3-beta-galactosyltransferase